MSCIVTENFKFSLNTKYKITKHFFIKTIKKILNNLQEYKSNHIINILSLTKYLALLLYFDFRNFLHVKNYKHVILY